jgi:hypothetical protein
MSKIVVLNIPASGHVNPTLPVVQELVRRGEQVIYYNNHDFRPQIERTGALFRPYPVTDYTSTQIASTLQGGDLYSYAVLLLRATENLLPFTLDELAREQPDLVIIDESVLWGRIAATRLNLRSAASVCSFVLDPLLKQLTLRESLHLLRQMMPKLPGLVAARSKLARENGKAFPTFRPMFPMRGELNVIFTIRELQPETPAVDKTFRFVGPSINPETRVRTFHSTLWGKILSSTFQWARSILAAARFTASTLRRLAVIRRSLSSRRESPRISRRLGQSPQISSSGHPCRSLRCFSARRSSSHTGG